MRKSFLNILSMVTFSLTLAACSSGSDGANGAPGKDGESAKVSSVMNCAGVVSGLTGNAGTALNGLRVEYDVIIMNTGDVYASASVSDQFSQISETAFYAANQTGASTGTISMVGDFHSTGNSASWTISLDRSSLVTTAIYKDVSLAAQSPVELQFTPAACNVEVFDEEMYL